MQVLVEQYRRAKEISARQLALKLEIAHTTLRNWEHHPEDFPVGALAQCCAIFGVGICQLVLLPPPQEVAACPSGPSTPTTTTNPTPKEAP